jgi:hypothetical protein
MGICVTHMECNGKILKDFENDLWKSCEIRRITKSKKRLIYFEIEKMEFSSNQLMRF